MAQAGIANANSLRKLPAAARRLIDENKQRRAGDKNSGNFRGRVRKTISYLRWKAACASLSDAIGYIASELERERLYGLYRKIFPKEWKASRASFHRMGYNDCHTEREIEFIELVNEHYFPLCSWLDWSDFRFDHIPIESVNYDFCCDEYEWQHFRPCLQFAITAFLWRDTDISDENWTDMLSSFDVRFEDLPQIERATPHFSVLNAGRSEPKIQRFIHLIEFIFHDSGNSFIDTTYCQPLDLYEWSFENLEKLKSDYAGVKDYFESMDSLDEDIARNASSTFKELITIWNTGRLPAKGKRKEAADKTEYERGLLINILAEYDQPDEAALTF
jgi:hypothetical protein